MELEKGLDLSEFDIHRGFLPKEDPLTELPGHFKFLDDFGRDIPQLIKSGNIIKAVRELPTASVHALNSLNRIERDRVMMIYGFGASACVHSTNPAQNLLVRQIAQPLCWLSDKFGKPPILSYCSYAMNNWKRKDSEKEIDLDNLELIQNFIDLYDEDWFILIHVAIEAKASLVVESAADVVWNVEQDNLNRIFVNLVDIYESLRDVIKILKRMPEHCSEEVYHREVRPWINRFENVIYEGVDDVPRSFKGETGAQSSIVPLLVAAFGIDHKETGLTQHLEIMRSYMPPAHRNLIQDIAKRSRLREFVLNSNLRALREAYTCCLERIYEFRKIHYEYATSYIHKRTNDPRGTGGTPFMEWLKQLLDETEAMYLK